MEALFAGGMRLGVLVTIRIETRNSVIQQRRRRHRHHYPEHKLCPANRNYGGYSGVMRALAARCHRTAVVESRIGAVAWAMRQRPVSHPRSSNAACGFPV